MGRSLLLFFACYMACAFYVLRCVVCIFRAVCHAVCCWSERPCLPILLQRNDARLVVASLFLKMVAVLLHRRNLLLHAVDLLRIRLRGRLELRNLQQ